MDSARTPDLPHDAMRDAAAQSRAEDERLVASIMSGKIAELDKVRARPLGALLPCCRTRLRARAHAQSAQG